MYELAFAKSFKKSIKRLLKSKDNKVIKKRLEVIIEIIVQRKILGPNYKDHPLQGAFSDYRECHIKPNVLLLYEVDQQKFLITLVNIGSHSDLFG